MEPEIIVTEHGEYKGWRVIHNSRYNRFFACDSNMNQVSGKTLDEVHWRIDDFDYPEEIHE